MPKLVLEFENVEDRDRWIGAYYDGGGEQEMDESWQQDGLDPPKIKITEED